MERPILALWALPLLASACTTLGTGAGDRIELEFVGAERSTNGDTGDARPTPELWGVNLVALAAESHGATEFGLQVADFGHAWRDGHEGYLELHVGARLHPAPPRSPLQPYLGAGVLLVVHELRYDHRGDSDSDADDDSGWNLDGSLGAYLSVGLGVCVGPLVLGAQARALLGNDVDRFARHSDDFATELAFTCGVRF